MSVKRHENSVNRQIILVSRPKGMPSEANFALRQVLIPQPKNDEVLIRSLYISVDPYMRGRMNDASSYIEPFQLNEPLTGGVVGEVIESKNSSFQPGDIVEGYLEWAEYSVADGANVRKLDPNLAPISTALGILGMPGMTAYFGLLDIGQPKPGETVVVSGAAGAVGIAAGQIAEIKGCRVVGITGSDEKVKYLTCELGFDAAINYKNPEFAELLKKSCPNGVDIYFDNVGGDITDSVFMHLNKHARIVMCGQIAMYNRETPDIGPRHFWQLLIKSAQLTGYIITDYEARFPEGIAQMAEWIREKKIRYAEHIIDGFENTPKAFIGLFKGENIGKMLVKV